MRKSGLNPKARGWIFTIMGLLMPLMGWYEYQDLNKMEQTGGTRSVHQLVYLTYKAAGKEGVFVLLVGLGITFLIIGILMLRGNKAVIEMFYSKVYFKWQEPKLTRQLITEKFQQNFFATNKTITIIIVAISMAVLYFIFIYSFSRTMGLFSSIAFPGIFIFIGLVIIGAVMWQRKHTQFVISITDKGFVRHTAKTWQEVPFIAMKSIAHFSWIKEDNHIILALITQKHKKVYVGVSEEANKEELNKFFQNQGITEVNYSHL